MLLPQFRFGRWSNAILCNDIYDMQNAITNAIWYGRRCPRQIFEFLRFISGQFEYGRFCLSKFEYFVQNSLHFIVQTGLIIFFFQLDLIQQKYAIILLFQFILPEWFGWCQANAEMLLLDFVLVELIRRQVRKVTWKIHGHALLEHRKYLAMSNSQAEFRFVFSMWCRLLHQSTPNNCWKWHNH